MDKGSLIFYIKTNDIYKDIAENGETRFNTLNYALGRTLPRVKDKKVISVTINELSGKLWSNLLDLEQKSIMI